MNFIKICIVLVAAGIGVMFSSLNAQSIQLNYLIGDTEISLVWTLIVAVLLGFLLALLIMIPRVVSRQIETRKYKRKLRQAEEEIKALRNMPIHDA